MNRSRRCLLLIWSPFAVSACESTPRATDGLVIRDSAGVEIVENSSSGWGANEGWRLSDEPLLTIGAALADDPAYLFSRITGLARLSDGRIGVLDHASQNLRYFDSAGNHLLTVGRAGQGPGEFRSPQGLFRLPGDSLVVDDPALPRRRLIFGPDGTFVREEALDFDRFRAMGPWGECQSPMLPDGSVLFCRPEDSEGRVFPSPPGHLRRFSRFARVTWDLDTIAPLGRDGGIEQWGIRVGAGTEFLIHPFHARSATTAGGDPFRIAIATNPEYSIEVWRPNGELERIVRRLPVLRPPTAAERGYVSENVQSWAGEELAPRALAEIDEPDFVPAVGGMLFDTLGNLWVARHQIDYTETPDFDIFDPEGRYLGGFRFPDSFMPREIGADYVLGVLRSDLDVPTVRMWGLQR